MGPGITLCDKPVLRGTLVVLRPVRVEDAGGLAGIDPETLRLTGTHQRFPIGVIEQWYATRESYDDRLDLSIVELASGEWVGRSCSTTLSPTTGAVVSGSSLRAPSSRPGARH